MSKSTFLHRRSGLLAVVLTVGLVVSGQVALAAPAFAVSPATIAVTDTTDADATNACTTASTTLSSPVTLRNALCVANNLGGSVTVDVAAGTYRLAPGGRGALVVGTKADSSISIVGAASGVTIVGDGAHQVFNLDPAMVGGVSVAMSNIAVTGGVDNSYGGGGIIGGSGSSDKAADTLSLDNVSITGNRANLTGSATNNPGGGIQFIGGALSINNSVINNNSSGSSAGGGVAYQAMGIAGESLTITNSTFNGNSTAASDSLPNGGGALVIDDRAGLATLTISGSTFTGNTVTNSAGAGVGSALWQRGGKLSFDSSTVAGNTLTGSAPGGALQLDGGTFTGHYNRISDNPGGAGLASSAVPQLTTIDATNNWWGCAGDPAAAACGKVVGVPASAYTPYLALTVTPATNPIVLPAQTSVFTTSVLKNSAGTTIPVAERGFLDGIPLSWSAVQPAGATISADSAALADGVATATFTARSITGAGSVTATVDGASVVAPVNVYSAPTITSGPATGFVAGTAGSFTVVAAGYPTPTITQAGTRPSGITFVDNHDGTATLSGTPAAGSGGSYTLAITASNAAGTPATQNLVLTVGEAPVFTSSASTSFATGTSGSFTVIADGFPVPTPITVTGTLPGGVSFVDNGDGTATLSGSPTASAGGTYPLTFSVTNGTAPDAVQSFVLTVTQAVTVTTQPASTTVADGGVATFTAAAGGFPTPTVHWESTTNGGTTWVPVAGATTPTLTVGPAPQSQSGTVYRAVFSNGPSSATSTGATLTVFTPVAFTSAASAAFTVNGTAQSFAVTTSGSPDATLSISGAPSWLTFTGVIGSGTRTIQGTPPIGSGGTYLVTLTATNGFGTAATQAFALTVNEAATITSPATAVFSVGAAGTFAIGMGTAYPRATTTTLLDPLPYGLGFLADPTTGTATITGTATAAAAGVHTVRITADNTIAPVAQQTLTITVTQAPVITRQPVSQDVATGTIVTFEAGATGYPLPTVQWQVQTGGTGVFADIVGETGTTLSLKATTALTGNAYRAIFTSGSSTVSTPATLTVGTIPAITSAADATFTLNGAGQAGPLQSFTVRSSGIPNAVLAATGAVPAWLTFTDNGDGTATLAGAPDAASAGVHTFGFTATNKYGAAAAQAFTLTVAAVPAITSAASAAFEVGVAGSVTISTNPGFPAATSLTATGTLPRGLSFVDRGDGTALLSGTPASGTGGTHTLGIVARNSVGASAPQQLVLTISSAPTLASATSTTFTRGVDSTFTIATTGGFPAPGVISAVGTLPSGITLTDNGDGTATLAGSTIDAAAAVTLAVSASNGVGIDAAQAFTLHLVDATPVPLPIILPTSDGQLAGAPTSLAPGQSVQVDGAGFAPGSTVTFGIYSTPRTLGTAIADANGDAHASLTLPTDLVGEHTLVASGIDRAGNPRFLTWTVEISKPAAVDPAEPTVPSSPSVPSSSGAGESSIAETGPSIVVGAAGLVALFLLGAGVILLVMRRRRSSH